MNNAHQRPKEPARVRRALLDAAQQIAVAQGLQHVTVQAVAQAAGVTKGGLLHHFASKQRLLDALFADLIEAYEQEISSRMASQTQTYGVFSRAYIETTMADITEPNRHPRAALCVLAISDAGMRKLWADRMNTLRRAHDDTDDDIQLAIARFAVDGYWLAQMIGSDERAPEIVRKHLISLTRFS